MSEYNAITVILFKQVRGKYQFYLVKRGEDLPVMPSSWTSITGLVTDSDQEMCNYFQNKYGEICEDMLNHLVVIRLLFERNLLPVDISKSATLSEGEVYQNLNEMDPGLLNVFCHSMIPAGNSSMTDGQNIFNVKYYLFISQTPKIFKRIKLVKTSSVYTAPEELMEAKGKWFSIEKITKKYERLEGLFSPSLIHLIQILRSNKLNISEAIRERTTLLDKYSYINRHIFPFIWKFPTPSPLLPPYQTTNIYVVGNEHKYIVDPGANSSTDLKRLEDFIEDNRDEIEGILLTNSNADHCNQALYLKEKYQFSIGASEETAEVLKKDGFTIDNILHEGSRISLGTYEPMGIEKWEIETIELPGVSKCSIGFWDPRGLLITGIALHHNLTSAPAIYTGSYLDLAESLQKLNKYPAKFAISAHGIIMSNVKKSLSKNIKRMKASEQEIISLLKKEITKSEQLIEIISSERTPERKRHTRSAVIANLEKLADEGKVIKRGEDYFWKTKKNSSTQLK